MPNFGCENDTEILEGDTKHNNLNYESRISYINLDDSETLKNYIEEIKVSENNNISVTNRTNTEESYSFTAIETDIIKIIGDSSISYTLKIIKDNQPINSFSNLVVEFVEEEDTNAFIINYYPSDDYLENISENRSIPFVGQINKQSIDYDGSLDGMFLRERCKSVTTTYCTFKWDHVAGPRCVDWPLYNQTTTVCTEVADANPIIDAGDSSGGGGDTPTAPNYVAPCESEDTSNNNVLVDEEGNCYDVELDNYLVECLEIDSPQNTNPDIAHWFYSLATYEQKISLRTLLEANSCNQSAKDFANSAIEAIIDGGEVDFEDNTIIHNSFSNNQKAKCVYDKMKNINGSVFANLLSKFDNSMNALLVFRVDNLPPGPNGLAGKGITLPRLNMNSTTTRYDIVLDQNFVQNASLIEIALAISHKIIHAELMARCVELGIITEMTFDVNTYNVGISFNNNPIITSNISDLLFSLTADQYTNFSNNNPSNSNWQHELFNTFNNRDKIAQNVEAVHPWLDDVSNPISAYINNALFPVTMDEYFKSISWFGLESTTEFNNLSDLEIAKKNQAYEITNQNYNRNCN